MGTAAEHQRQGAGRAVLEYAIRYHTERGATTFYLLATAAGKPLYERVGFRTYSEGAVWVAGASTQVSGH
jgi:GNAT superfamily N-acetyltransferase